MPRSMFQVPDSPAAMTAPRVQRRSNPIPVPIPTLQRSNSYAEIYSRYLYVFLHPAILPCSQRGGFLSLSLSLALPYCSSVVGRGWQFVGDVWVGYIYVIV
jgi:hypothetical protein